MMMKSKLSAMVLMHPSTRSLRNSAALSRCIGQAREAVKHRDADFSIRDRRGSG
jgi:hypothetical protein